MIRFTACNSVPGASSSNPHRASIQAWPAAGGGLLLGVDEPCFAGPAPHRAPIKTLFIRLDCTGAIVLLLPYVRLEPEARYCLHDLVAGELYIPPVDITLTDGQVAFPSSIVDLSPAAELGARAAAAAVRSLLIAAAGEEWNIGADHCWSASGVVHAEDRALRYGELAVDAAFCAMPDLLRLRCGRAVPVAPSVRPESRTVFAM